MVAIISGLLSAGCSVFGVRNEQTPAYTVERTIGPDVEIRRYGPRLAAETAVSGSETAARSQGFQRLASYIFGGNTTKSSIDMTAPVAQTKTIDMTAPVAQSRTTDGRWRIRFFMPENYTLETLPSVVRD
ncbi:MAG: heme-binding protein [Alphaproteobacteria bacterium]|nr:MAG: heme-binding protein [Alphaproteobacteria bacterium]